MVSLQAPGRSTSPELESVPLSVILNEDASLPDEPLPTYREALLDRAKSVSRVTAFPPQSTRTPINLIPSSPTRPTTTAAAEAQKKPSVLAVLICFTILGFAIALIGGVSGGYHYVVDFSNPSPPFASLDSIMANKDKFLGYTIGGMLFAYPFFFLTLLVGRPQMFSLPRRQFTEPTRLSQSLGPEQARKKRNHCMGICCGLSALYVIIVVMALWGTIHLAGTRLDGYMVSYASEDWAENFILLGKTWNGSSAAFYSPTGIKLGDIGFSDSTINWRISLNNNTISTIIYSDPDQTQNIQLTAFCRSDTNETSQTRSCITGSLTNDPVKSTKGPTGPPSGEFAGDFNLTLSSPNRTDIFNSTIHLRAGNSDYQGIGKKYAPLGYWYLGSAPVIHVIWNSTQNRACDGLRINLSKQYQSEGFTLVGMIWEWWKVWAQNGDCSWDLNGDDSD